MRVYLRLLFAFIALALLLVSGAGVFYVWETLIHPEREIEEEIVRIRKQKKQKIDHGAKTYNDAVTLFSTGALGGGVEKLHELMKFYDDSEFYPEAKRVVGEINVDRLLSKSLTPGKHEYIVKKGDSLLRIAQQKQSTVGYIIHVNARMGASLQRGDQLIVSPLNFTILISLGSKTLTLQSEGGNFFKEYPLKRYRFPASCPSQFDTQIQSLIVGSGDTMLPVGSSSYVAAVKELRCLRRGVPLRPVVADSEANKYISGFFLGREDLEELVLLIRPGTKVHVRK
ncbi:MAG: LysM peptidoglycan-binding domain-containing protein [Verrucomicrobiaceae bacterium]|nr:LysM peptidoglycan-binding domain-containing protein [Verrucomicrobiaceae bacterium]